MEIRAEREERADWQTGAIRTLGVLGWGEGT